MRVSRLLISLLISAGVMIPPLAAGQQTSDLDEILAQVYNTSPAILAERESLRALNHELGTARAGLRPNISATGSLDRVKTKSTPQKAGELTTDTSRTTRRIGLTGTQAIYDGGQTTASVAATQSRIQAARAQYLMTEQNTLLEALRSYMNLLYAQLQLDLQQTSEAIVQQNLDRVVSLREAGEATRTQVAQAESRLAAAQASSIQALGSLNRAEANFTKAVGTPAPLILRQPRDLPTRPQDLANLLERARRDNLAVIATRFQLQAARDNLDRGYGAIRPKLNAKASISDTRKPSPGTKKQTDTSIGIELTVPIYAGGKSFAGLRGLRAKINQQDLLLEQAERQATQQAIDAWHSLNTARASRESFGTQITAAETALVGLNREYDAGFATILDLLDGEKELLSAQLNALGAWRDEIIASYSLLAVTGDLTAQRLELDVEIYDFAGDYQDAQRWFN
ncbi:MAG: TolC family outer membrane protein [Pseudomonadota bacterium]